MKKIAVFLMLIALMGFSNRALAQVDNYCLEFTSADGVVNLGKLSSFTDASYTLQFWFNPTTWDKGACLIRAGQFSIKLGNNHALVLNDGTNHLTITDTNMSAGRWTQVTVRGNTTSDSTIVILNNQMTYSTDKCLSLTAKNYSVWLGGGYKGRLDEVRLFKIVLPDTYASFWNNTLNTFCPSWSNLVGYWKMDEEQCSNVVNYKYIFSSVSSGKVTSGTHGTMSSTGVQKVKVTDNSSMRYCMNLAYDNWEHMMRSMPNVNQYGVLTNHVAILAGGGYDSGHCYLLNDNNEGTLSDGCEYEETWGTTTTGGKRSGVLHLTTEDATFTAPTEALPSTTTAFTFEGWFYVDEWKEGGLLMEKRLDDDHYLTIRLDSIKTASTKTGSIIVSYNGKEFKPTGSKEGKWFYVSFTSEKLDLGGSAIGLGDSPIVFGKGLKCRLDNICFRSDVRTATEMTTDKTVKDNLGSGTGFKILTAYYDFDLQDHLGFDSWSIQGFFKKLREDAGNLRGQKWTVSLHQMYMTSMDAVMSDESKRQIMANDIIKIINSPYVDGIDIDYEWYYNVAGWTKIAKMVRLIRQGAEKGKIISVSPHQYTYNYPTGYMSDVDYFNFQQYGPQTKNSYYSNFTSNAQAFVNYGYPKDKIMLSFSTTSDNSNGGGTVGYNWCPNLISDDDDNFVYNGLNYRINCRNQVINRTLFARDNNYGGIFYWDMCNDVDPGNERSYSRTSSMYVNANVEPLVTAVKTAATDPASDETAPVATEDPEDQGGNNSVELMTMDDVNTNVKALNIINSKGLGIIYSNSANTNLWLAESSNATFSSSIDNSSKKALWMLLNKSGKYYLYNVERGEFVTIPDYKNTSYACTFTTTPTPLEMTSDGNGSFTFRMYGNTQSTSYLCASPQNAAKPVCQWTSTDNGSTWNLSTVEDFDATNALAGLNAVIEYAADTTAWNNANTISTLDALDNTVAYNIVNTNGLGTIYNNTAQTNVWMTESSNSNFAGSINHFIDNTLWMIYNKEGKYYLWNTGAEKFVTIPDYVKTSYPCTFTSDPTPLEMTGNNGIFTFREYGNTQSTSFMCAAPQCATMPLCQYTISDKGSQWSIIAFPQYDTSAALEKIKVALGEITGIESPNPTQPQEGGSIYDMQGRRLSVVPTHGIFIYNGKKIIR